MLHCTSSIIFLSVRSGSIQRNVAEETDRWPGFPRNRTRWLGWNAEIACCGGSFRFWFWLWGCKSFNRMNYCHWLQSKVLSHIVCTHNVPTMHRTSPADINGFHNVLTCWNKWKRKWLLINESESGSVKVKEVNPVSRWLRILRLPMHEQWGITSAT